MYSKVTEFIEDWEYESESTLKVFEQLTDDSLNKKFMMTLELLED